MGTSSDCTVSSCLLINFELLNGHFKLLQSTVSPKSFPYSISAFEFLYQGEIAVVLGSMWLEHNLYTLSRRWYNCETCYIVLGN